MKICRPKGKFPYEWIPGPFSSPAFVNDTQAGSETSDGLAPVEFPDGCYLVIQNGQGKYLGKDEFEAGFEPTKVKKVQPASTSTSTQGSRRGSSKKGGSPSSSAGGGSA